MIAIASALMPFLGVLFSETQSSYSGQKAQIDDETPLVITISFIASTVLLIPAMLIVFFTQMYLNSNETAIQRHQQIHNWTFIGSMVLSTTLLIMLQYSVDRPGVDVFATFCIWIGALYMFVGLAVWNIMYRIYKKKPSFSENGDLLDSM